LLQAFARQAMHASPKAGKTGSKPATQQGLHSAFACSRQNGQYQVLQIKLHSSRAALEVLPANPTW
jgi:hypothetical protein